jgi:hypothetical protein
VRRRQCGKASAEVRIGDHVTYDGRLYVVCGLDPMGVPERRADLEDVETGERVRVALSEIQYARD